jgi:hypothetical protein
MEEQQQQEQPKESTLAELAERIKKLEEYVATQAVPTFDDIYKMFAAVLKKAQAFEVETIKNASGLHAEHNTYLRETRDRLIENFRSLETKIDQDLQDIRRRFNERIGQEIVKVTSDAIAEALTKRVLTVRTAQRGENVDVVIRQASPAEVRATKLF